MPTEIIGLRKLDYFFQQANFRTLNNDSAVGRGSKNIVRVPGFQPFTLMRDRLVSADENGLDEGWMFNGQKVFCQVISATAGFTTVVGMNKFFRRLAS